MSISDEDLAEALAIARGLEPGEMTRAPSVLRGWLNAAKKARELLTPEPPNPELTTMLRDGERVYQTSGRVIAIPSHTITEIPAPVFKAGGVISDGTPVTFRPGDIVSVRAVVQESANGQALYRVKGENYTFRANDSEVTLIERPAPPEPDWEPGDVAQDERGRVWSYAARPGVPPWLAVNINGLITRRKREEIPGTLTPCDVVPRTKSGQ